MRATARRLTVTLVLAWCAHAMARAPAGHRVETTFHPRAPQPVRPTTPRLPSLALGVTSVAAPPRPAVALATRVEALALRVSHPRLPLASPVVRAIGVTPTWPCGAMLGVEYALPDKR
jgi:hypothetical protein